MIKWCFCTLAFRNDPLEDVIIPAAELGFDELEVFYGQVVDKSAEELAALRSLAEKKGIGISGVAPYFWFTQNDELLEETFTIARRAIEINRALGGRMIRTFTDSGPTGIGSAVATPEQWNTAVKGLQTLLDEAPDLQFSVETHEKTLADTLASTLDLFARVNRPNLKITYQPYNDGDIVEDYHALRDRVVQVHLNPLLGTAGKPYDLPANSLDYPGLIRALAADGYSGDCALEFCKPGVDWDTVSSALSWARAQAEG